MSVFESLENFRFPRACGIFVLSLSIVNLAFWVGMCFISDPNTAILNKSIGKGVMDVISSFGLLLFSTIALIFEHNKQKKIKKITPVSLSIALFVSAIGFVLLSEFLLGVSITGFFFAKTLSLSSTSLEFLPLHPSPFSAIGFSLLGFALFTGPFAQFSRNRLSQTLLMITCLGSLQTILDLIILSFGKAGSSISAFAEGQAAFSILVLSLVFLFTGLRRGHMRLFFHEDRPSQVTRFVVISLLIVPPLLNFSFLLSEKLFLFSSRINELLFSFTNITFVILLVLRAFDKLRLAERLQTRVSRTLRNQELDKEKARSDQLIADAIKVSETRLRMIFNASFDAIVGFNFDAIITEWNPRAEKLFGWSYNDAVGKRFFDLLYPYEVQKKKLAEFQGVRGKSEDLIFEKPIEAELIDKNGKKVSIRMGISHMEVANEVLFIASIHDITEEKKSENELILSREQALSATRSKSEFLANMSHEIRTPMNGVIGMATVLLESQLSESQRASARLIKESAESLLSIINGILDHSKIEAGKLELEHRSFSFEEVAKDVIQILRLSANEKGIELRIEIQKTDLDPNEISFVLGDSGRLRQILVNLISNAIKFTEVGEVLLRVIARRIDQHNVHVRFAIVDTGPGLSDDEKNQLFTLYGQTKTGMKKGGTGLGLYISSQLINLMKGKYGVESEVGIGSTFWFELEFEFGEKELAHAEIIAQSKSKQIYLSGHVLVAEDQLINQRVIGSYLAKLGVSFDIAPNGAVALELLQKNKYDLILMDCRMPILDGYEATAKIRELEKNGGAPIPIVALSAEISTDDRKRCIALGMDEFLGKPLDMIKLTQCLAKWLFKEREQSFVVDENALAKLAGLTSGEQDLITVLIAEFSRSANESVDQMHIAYQKQNLKAISDIAHGLKSTSATLGLIRVAEMCQAIESLPQIPSNMVGLIARLEVEVLLAETDLTRLRSGQAP